MLKMSKSVDTKTPAAATSATTETESSSSNSSTDPPDGRGTTSAIKEVFFLPTSSSSTPLLHAPDIDLTWLLLMGLASGMRLISLTKPSTVVFDEVHFGRFISYFMKGQFFFDVHPPLGKLLYAFIGYLCGYDGAFQFESIGQNIPPEHMEFVSYLRFVPALFSVFLVPTVYEIVLELGGSYWFAVLGGLLVCFENMMVVQSRFILIDSPMLFFIAASIWCYVKFLKSHSRPFHMRWWLYLFGLGITLACTVSVKYNGIFTVILIGAVVALEMWLMILDASVPALTVYKHLAARFLCLCVVPVFLYLLQFYVMFAVLYKTGPHDNLMSSSFQRTLEGGLKSITKDQSEVVAYGSQITLRNTHSKQCWLHSHNHLYPIKYPDGRGSSAQQQVTCYGYKDVNNWFIVKHPDKNTLTPDFPPVPVLNGDVVNLVHGTTGRGLNAHDVAAPLTPTLMEVSGYIDHNVSMEAQFGWRVEIVNPDPSNKWRAIESQIRLVHVNTSASLRVSGGLLPDWGFHQYEVGTDRMKLCEQCVWNVEEHHQNITVPPEITKEEAQKILTLKDKDVENLRLSFLQKFWEYQCRMFQVNTDLAQGHAFSSRPTEWPLMRRGVAYWIDQSSNKQIFCIGNPIVWWVGSLSILFYSALALVYLLRRQRAVYDMSAGEWNVFVIGGYLLVGGYLINYIPYFPSNKLLFVHSYLPALLYKVILIPVFANHFYSILFKHFSALQSLLKIFCTVYCLAVVWGFHYFSAFTYGTKSLSTQDIQSKKWFSTWDFLSHSR